MLEEKEYQKKNHKDFLDKRGERKGMKRK